MSSKAPDDALKKYKDTLNLPQTEFPIRPRPQEDDPQMIKRWESEELYYKTFISNSNNSNNNRYILHDGPPYANGNIHLGHAYNKILKDILCKSKRMKGYNVPVTPGWDCHGLPIELKVTQENPGLDRVSLKKACRAYARKWIDVQREQFKSLGVLMNWKEPYVTMDPQYEADTVKAFGILVSQGFIERKNKTVPWCASCQTVLASAEIEYQDRKDPSIYVLFELAEKDRVRLFKEYNKPIYFLVWTTTPWTLPLNRAVMLKSQGDYQLVDLNGTYVIVGSLVADSIAQLAEAQKLVLKDFKANYLDGVHALHPLGEYTVPVIFDESVGVEEGTACVHTAPGCGPIDYEIGVKNKLEIFSPISAAGTYTCGIAPQELENMAVADGQIWVIKKLIEREKLFYKGSLKHSYPHCWRCRQGLIFRATPQWFFDLDKHNIKQKALESINSINFIPARGKNFLKATVENRWEWCLSRQRVWGTPIPALLCTGCDYTYITQELINLVAQGIEKEGIEYWDLISLDDICKMLKKDIICSYCKSDNKKSEFKKEQDILDVWFDSGVSHYAVLYNNKHLAFPADIYLEGIDQYRGWFQSSLLTSLVLEQEPAMKAIMSHGFTVDEKGRKMSKSIGNVVSPDNIVAKLGVDGLRLWVASIGHEGDAVVSQVLMQNVAEVFRKIRNTCRFLLSNLYDFDNKKDSINLKDLLSVDQYALTQLNSFNKAMLQEYEDANFTGVFHGLADYCTTELSAFYLDIVKDRLYVGKKDGIARRSAQTVLWHILDVLVKLMAPILSITAEQLSDYYQPDKKESIHLQGFTDTQKLVNILYEAIESNRGISQVNVIESNCTLKNINTLQKDLSVLELWKVLKAIRNAVLKSIEREREQGNIKHSLEAHVKLFVDIHSEKYSILKDFLESFESKGKKGQDLTDFWKEFFIVSQFDWLKNSDNLPASSLEGVWVGVEKASGSKCPRCWHWSNAASVDGLCDRCQLVLEG